MIIFQLDCVGWDTCGLCLQEKLYIELKNILGRQPGPEVAEQLAIYQENLKRKVPRGVPFRFSGELGACIFDNSRREPSIL